MSEKLWLNIGCGDDLMEGFVNVDKPLFPDDPARFVDEKGFEILEHDLSMHWPWKDSVADFILAKDIIEHLPDKIRTMNEAWRVLKPYGIIQIQVPTTDGLGAFQDPTHVSYWNRNSFKYYEEGNVYRDRFAGSYGIKARFKVMQENVIATQDGPQLLIYLEARK